MFQSDSVSDNLGISCISASRISAVFSTSKHTDNKWRALDLHSNDPNSRAANVPIGNYERTPPPEHEVPPRELVQHGHVVLAVLPPEPKANRSQRHPPAVQQHRENCRDVQECRSEWRAVLGLCYNTTQLADDSLPLLLTGYISSFCYTPDKLVWPDGDHSLVLEYGRALQ